MAFADSVHCANVKPLLFLRHDRHETFGLAATVLPDAGVDYVVSNLWDLPFRLPGLNEVSGIVAFGGDMNVDKTDAYPGLIAERALVREAIVERVPVLGFCFGAQLIARALDAPVYRAPVAEFGFSPLELTESGRTDLLLSAFRDGDMVFLWHEDTFELPPGTDLLATGSRVPMHAFRAGPAAWAFQFHIEVDPPELDAWIAAAGDRIEQKWGRPAEAVKEEAASFLAAQQERATELLGRFAVEVRRAAADRRPERASSA